MDVTKPYEFIGFGAMAATKPYEFMGFGAMDVRAVDSADGGLFSAHTARVRVHCMLKADMATE